MNIFYNLPPCLPLTRGVSQSDGGRENLSNSIADTSMSPRDNSWHSQFMTKSIHAERHII